MFDDTFLKKKRLLARRDILLEEIGQTVLDAGDLPPEFELLPKEFHGMAALLSQLKDRYRCLIEERDRVNLDLEDYQRLLHEKNREFEKLLKPHRRDCDELRLKLDYFQDQLQKKTRSSKTGDEWQTLESCFREAEAKRTAILAQWETCRQGYLTHMAPLTDRFNKLELAIGKNREEAESLSSERRKRLRDLGHWHSSGDTPKDRYREKFAELETVRRELAETRRTIRPEKPAVASKKDNGHWNWLMAAALLAALIGYFFRTEFHQENISLAGFVSGFMPEDKSFRLFVNLNRVGHESIASDIPVLETLPGGETVFRGLGTADLLSIAIARQGSSEGSLMYCGLKFRKPPTRFSTRLRQLGWRYEPTQHGYKALADGEWLWLIINERTFFLLPVTRLAEFEAQKNNPSDDLLKLVQHIQSYDNNQALLQGFDTLSFTLKDEFFRLSLWSREQILADLDLRMRYVNALNLASPKVHFSFAGNRLNVTGGGTDLPSTVYSGKELRSEVITLVNNLLQRTKTQLDDKGEHLQKNDLSENRPASGDQKLLVFDLRGEPLTLVGEHVIGTDITDLDLHNQGKGILITDRGDGVLLSFHLLGRDLQYDRHLAFAETTADQPDMAGFIPAATIIAPGEDVAAVLEAHGENSRGKPRVALIQLPELTVLSVEEMPKDVRACLSAVWDKEGKFLYLGCATLKRRGKMGPAVLVYRREGSILSLTRLIERPYKRGLLSIPSLVRHPRDPLLFFYQLPEEILVRYDVEEGNETSISLAFSTPREASLPRPANRAGVLLLNRTGDRALLLGSSNSQSEGRLHFVTLADLKSATLSQVDTLDLENMPGDAVRLPLSDRFCIVLADRGLTIVRLAEDRLSTEKVHAFESFLPQRLATDQWGHFLFVSGKIMTN